MTIVVQKFGGSSLADIERLGHVADLVSASRAPGRKLIVVVSAMGKTTESLLERARAAASPNAAIEAAAPELPRRELDMLVSSGERVSMALLSIALHARGVRAVSLTGSQAGIVTNTLHFDARIQEIRRERILSELQHHDVIVVAGYQGVSAAREITTLGRGGSDTTAVALAAAFEAERCEIYSDVDGVYTADPNRVPAARHLPSVDYATLQEMTDAGAKVLNARAVGWGERHAVPIHARRTSDFAQGQLGRETCVSKRQTAALRAVVVNRALAVLTASSGARECLLQAAAELSLDVRDVCEVAGRVHATVPLVSVPDFESVREKLLRVGPNDLIAEDGFAEICAIGEGLDWRTPGGRAALSALGPAPLLRVQTQRRLSSIVPLSSIDAAEQRWHQLFVEAA
ncbi:MAG: aspartate kinase [Myxococcota bacterium]